MVSKMLPANVALLNPSRARLGLLLPVESLDIHGPDGDFHPQGLYSTEIFGKPGEHQRQIRPSYIDMNTSVFHPKFFQDLVSLKVLYRGILSGTVYAVWDDKEKDFIKSDVLDGETGYSFFCEHFEDLVFKSNNSPARQLRLTNVEKWRTRGFYRYMTVAPAGLRDIEVTEDGHYKEDDINPLYRKVLRIANTMIYNPARPNDPINDTSRWSMQVAINAIHQHYVDFLSGKHGFLYSKWASRSIAYGTRNIITAMDQGVPFVGGFAHPTINDTLVGLYQFMKGTVDKCIYGIRNGIASDLISAIPGNMPVVDRKTLELTYVEPTQRTIDKWGTDEGIESLINGYRNEHLRDKPVLIEDHYLALIYRGKKHFRVFNDIRELPAHLDRKLVKPLSWTEFFYISLYMDEQKSIGYTTRYPIIGTGSIYASHSYIRTTLKAETLAELGPDWTPLGEDHIVRQMPIIGASHFESMSVHPSKNPGLNADNDGDKCSYNVAFSEDAVEEGVKFLSSPDAYISASGKLNYGILRGGIESSVLKSFTTGLK